MTRICELTEKRPQSGNKVSHSNIKTRRRFLPNLQPVSFYSETLGTKISFSVAASTIRTVDKNGGIDGFLLSTPNSRLSPEAISLKKKVKKAAGVKAS